MTPIVSVASLNIESDGSTLLDGAQAALQEGKFGPALIYLDRAIEADPGNSEAHMMRASIAATMPPDRMGFADQSGIIEGDIETVLADMPDNADALFLRAWSKRGATDPRLVKQTLSDLGKVLLIAPDTADAHALHGVFALRNNDFETAAAAFARARRLNGAVADEYAIAAIAALVMSDVEDPSMAQQITPVLLDIDKALTEDPGWAAGYAIKGLAALASMRDEADFEPVLADLVAYARLSFENKPQSPDQTGPADVWTMTRASTDRYGAGTVETVLGSIIHFAVMGELQLSDELVNRIVDLELPLSVSGIEFPDALNTVEAVAVSPKGNHIAGLSGDMGSDISLWDATTGMKIFSTTIGTPGFGCSTSHPLAYDPRGSTIAAINCQQVFIIDANTGKVVAKIPHTAQFQPSLASIAYSPSGDEIVTTTNDGWVEVWETDTGGHLQSIVLDDTTQSVITAFDQVGTSILAEDANSRLSRWDAATGAKIEDILDIRSSVRMLYPIPKSDLIAATYMDDSRIELVDMVTGQTMHTLQAHRAYIWDVCASTDARYIASASADGSVLVCDMATGELVSILGHHALASSVCFGANSDTLFSSGWDGSVRVWDVSDGKERVVIAVGE